MTEGSALVAGVAATAGAGAIGAVVATGAVVAAGAAVAAGATVAASPVSGGAVGVWAMALQARASTLEQIRKVVFIIIGLLMRCSRPWIWIQLLGPIELPGRRAGVRFVNP